MASRFDKRWHEVMKRRDEEDERRAREVAARDAEDSEVLTRRAAQLEGWRGELDQREQEIALLAGGEMSADAIAARKQRIAEEDARRKTAEEAWRAENAERAARWDAEDARRAQELKVRRNEDEELIHGVA